MRKTLVLILAIAVLVGAGFSLHTYRESVLQKQHIRREFVMGTLLTLQAYGPKSEAAFAETVKRMHEITDKMTINDSGSETLELKLKAGTAAVALSDDTFMVLSKAIEYARDTDGAFDPTVEPLVSLWRIGFPDARVPSAEEIESRLPLVAYTEVQLDAANKTAYLPTKGMGIDLGAIAKGYAADEAQRIMRESGVKSALISVGGNVYAIGRKPDGQKWRIGIQDPFDTRNRVMATLDVEDETLVTSGGYERYLEVDEKRYHHILDPETGYPAETDLLSVTIVGDRSLDADALSTSLFIMGRQRALEFAEQSGWFEAILIDDNMQVYATSGIRERLVIVNPQYKARF